MTTIPSNRRCYRTSLMWVPEKKNAGGDMDYCPAFQFILVDRDAGGRETVMHFFQCRIVTFTDGTCMAITSKIKSRADGAVMDLSQCLRDLRRFEMPIDGRLDINARVLLQVQAQKLREYSYNDGIVVTSYRNHPAYDGYMDVEKLRNDLRRSLRQKGASGKLRPPKEPKP